MLVGSHGRSESPSGLHDSPRSRSPRQHRSLEPANGPRQQTQAEINGVDAMGVRANCGDEDEAASSVPSSDKHDEQGRTIKTCKLCGASCWSKTPLVLGSPMQQGWGSQIPWHRGAVDSPSGKLGRICVNAYGIVMQPEYGSLKSYMVTMARDPAKHAHIFPGVREKYITLHNEDPEGRVTKKEMGTVVDVEKRHEDELIAPEEEFVTEEAWANEVERKTGARPVRSDYPNLPWEQKVFRNGPAMWGYVELTGAAGRFKIRKKDSTAVSRRTRVHEGPEILVGEASNKAQIAAESLLAGWADTSNINFDSMLRLMEGKQEGSEGEGSDSSQAEEKADSVVENQNEFQASATYWGMIVMFRGPRSDEADMCILTETTHVSTHACAAIHV